jgi:hypothetical protein
VDIDSDVIQFAKTAVYSLEVHCPRGNTALAPSVASEDLRARTFGDQTTSVFQRMSYDEIDEMFECEGDRARVKEQFREGIIWRVGNAGDSHLIDVLGLQDIVVANRFLCHMQREQAESCLRNLSRLVKPGGYLFVSGIDLEVRSRVARELGWVPVRELLEEIHEGDPSLREDWPLQYWGLEPLNRRRRDWRLRYASVFQIGGASLTKTVSNALGNKSEEICALGER